MLALGGNAMTNPDGRARPEDQIAAAEVNRHAPRIPELQRHGFDLLKIAAAEEQAQVGPSLTKARRSLPSHNPGSAHQKHP